MSAACGSCAVDHGDEHDDGCTIARCLWTGRQRIQCNGWAIDAVKVLKVHAPDLAEELRDYFDLDDDHDCGRDRWDGTWPGEDDAKALDLWCYWGPDYGERGWVECTADHPGAQADLNRLHEPHARWDRGQGKWVKP